MKLITNVKDLGFSACLLVALKTVRLLSVLPNKIYEVFYLRCDFNSINKFSRLKVLTGKS